MVAAVVGEAEDSVGAIGGVYGIGNGHIHFCLISRVLQWKDEGDGVEGRGKWGGRRDCKYQEENPKENPHV